MCCFKKTIHFDYFPTKALPLMLYSLLTHSWQKSQYLTWSNQVNLNDKEIICDQSSRLYRKLKFTTLQC